MKALCWHGKHDMRCETVPDPRIEHPRDAIIKVTSCAICGSDLHMYDRLIPSMKSGDVVGHETMGEVVEVGSGNRKLKVGDRVVVSRFPAASASFASAVFIPVASAPIPTPGISKSYRATPRPASLAIRTIWAASPAARPNICACRTPMWGQ